MQKGMYYILTTTKTKTNCQQYDKKVYRIILLCPVVAKEQYVKQRDRVCA
jgi:hypothetical protein